MNNLNLHKVTSVTIAEPRILEGIQAYAREIIIHAESGDIEINLFSNNVDALEIIQIKAEDAA